jgi:hypothetical protein
MHKVVGEAILSNTFFKVVGEAILSKLLMKLFKKKTVLLVKLSYVKQALSFLLRIARRQASTGDVTGNGSECWPNRSPFASADCDRIDELCD